MKRFSFLVAGGTLLLACDMAFAAGDGPSFDLMDVDGMAAIWTIIVFVALLIILRAFAWKPIQKALADREAFIRDSLEQARKEREAAEAKLQEYNDRLAEARTEATAIVEEGRRDAEVLKTTIEERAKDEATAMVARAKREIELATTTAVNELYSLSANLATGVASRIIKKELSPADHERLIAESIDELRATGGNGQSLN